MYFVVCALMMLVGLWLATPGGARTAVDWRRLSPQGGPKRESGSRPDLVRTYRQVGVATMVGVPVIVLIYLL